MIPKSLSKENDYEKLLQRINDMFNLSQDDSKWIMENMQTFNDQPDKIFNLLKNHFDGMASEIIEEISVVIGDHHRSITDNNLYSKNTYYLNEFNLENKIIVGCSNSGFLFKPVLNIQFDLKNVSTMALDDLTLELDVESISTLAKCLSDT